MRCPQELDQERAQSEQDPTRKRSRPSGQTGNSRMRRPTQGQKGQPEDPARESAPVSRATTASKRWRKRMATPRNSNPRLKTEPECSSQSQQQPGDKGQGELGSVKTIKRSQQAAWTRSDQPGDNPNRARGKDKANKASQRQPEFTAAGSARWPVPDNRASSRTNRANKAQQQAQANKGGQQGGQSQQQQQQSEQQNQQNQQGQGQGQGQGQNQQQVASNQQSQQPNGQQGQGQQGQRNNQNQNQKGQRGQGQGQGQEQAQQPNGQPGEQQTQTARNQNQRASSAQTARNKGFQLDNMPLEGGRGGSSAPGTSDRRKLCPVVREAW